MAQPNIEILTQSLTSVTQEVSRMGNLPAIDNGNAVLTAITRLEASLQKVATDMQALRTYVQAFRTDITGRVSTLERYLTVQGFNAVARLRNSQIRSRDTAFSQVQTPNGEIPANFPANISSLSTVRSPELTQLLLAYGIEPGQTVDEKVRMFKLHIGFIDVSKAVVATSVHGDSLQKGWVEVDVRQAPRGTRMSWHGLRLLKLTLSRNKNEVAVATTATMRSLLSFLLLGLLGLVHALRSSGSRLLVVIEEATEKEKYSTFWGDLEARGYRLSFDSPKNEKLSLFKHGERAYDHLILLPPKSKGLGPALTANSLLKFINNQGNILLTLSATTPTPSAISSLLVELDIHLPPDRNSLVVDHFNYDTLSAGERHDVLLLPQPDAPRPDVKNYFGGPGTIAFPRSVGQVLGNQSPFLAPILRAPSTAYSYNPKDEVEAVEEPFATGQQMTLVSAMQARNSARFTVLGSVEALEDEWFNGKVQGVGKAKGIPTANRDFARALSAWTFMEIGVLKVGRMEHYLSSSTAEKAGNDSVAQLGYLNPKIYRVKNDVTFSIELSEYYYDHLQPLTVPQGDVLQLEFTMLSPFHRLALHPISQTANSTIFGTSFTLPDQHGIFTFRVNYKRPFLTNVDEKTTVTVRHFAHDEWPRSWRISGAWVWIAGIWVTVAGWLAFIALWLWSEPAYERSKGKKTQ